MEITRERRGNAGPDFDPGAVGGIGHRNVVDIDVLDEIYFAGILAQASHRDAMGAITLQSLNDNVRTVGLEGNAIVTVVDDRVLNCNAAGSISIPSVSVLRCIVGFREAGDEDVGEGDR